MGAPRSIVRLTDNPCTSIAHLEGVDTHLPHDGKPLPEADRFVRNNTVNDVACAILPLAHATLERIRVEESRTKVVGVNYDALCGAVEQLGATYRTGWWHAVEREDADFLLREVEILDRLNAPTVHVNWRDADKITDILHKMPASTLRHVTHTSSPMVLRFMVLLSLRAGHRGDSFDKTISIPHLIRTHTGEYRTRYWAGSAV